MRFGPHFSQAALELNVNLDLLVGDAAEYKFEPTRFDLIVLFYRLDRNLLPNMVSALKPGRLLICKMSLHCDPDGGLTRVRANPLGRNKLPLLVPELHVLFQKERPVRGRGVKYHVLVLQVLKSQRSPFRQSMSVFA
jgi:SAM-dependent methyltransferase